jgi:hypothetical protein
MRAAAAAAVLAVAPAAAGDVVPHKVADAALAAIFAGATVAGSYSDGRAFVETTAADGTTHYAEEGSRVRPAAGG